MKSELFNHVLHESGRLSGICREPPLHDASSHSADAARTFAEAHSHGMVAPVIFRAKPRRALM